MVQRRREPSLVRGLIAGIAAGLVASAAMHAFQAAAAKAGIGAGGDDDPATVKAADAAYAAATGAHLPDDAKTAAGSLVHYAVGSALGIAYGIAAEYRPEASAGKGLLFGAITELLIDEASVPALGLSKGPLDVPAATHLLGFASHAVYGVVAEMTRAAVAEALVD